MLWQKKRYKKKNSMFALITSGRPNFLFGTKLCNPKKYPAQSNCEKKKTCTRKLPSPRQKNITSLTCSGFQRFHCDFAVNRQVKSMNSVSKLPTLQFHASVSDFLKSTKFRISRDEYFAWNALLKAFEIFQHSLSGFSRYLFQYVFSKHSKSFVQIF